MMVAFDVVKSLLVNIHLRVNEWLQKHIRHFIDEENCLMVCLLYYSIVAKTLFTRLFSFFSSSLQSLFISEDQNDHKIGKSR